MQGPRVTFPRAGDGDATVIPERFGRVELSADQVLYRAGLGAARVRYSAQTRANAWEERRAENDLILEVSPRDLGRPHVHEVGGLRAARGHSTEERRVSL